MFREKNCNELTHLDEKKRVKLAGWVNKRRDLGSFIFIDLRDRYGITQLIFDPEVASEVYERAKEIRNEWVISIEGEVVLREKENPNLKTGKIEVIVRNLQVLSKSKTPPFAIFEENSETNEELRLKYRYLDIRRKNSMDKIKMRHIAMLETRNYFSEHGFLEVNTPILCKSTPEGARDYLVPSRIYKGNFFALPQSPQIFKQLLMIGSIDRYFQIAPCFRDEDLRAARQPEFTQIDVEMSFDGKEKLFEIVENHMKRLFKKCIDIDIKTPFVRMSYFESLEHYGTDKPDLRFGLKFQRLDEILNKSSFEVFANTLKNNGAIKAFKVENASDLSRKKLDAYSNFVKSFGLKGLFFLKKEEGKILSSLNKFFDESILKKIDEKFEMKNSDVLFIASDSENIVNQALDHLRRKIAQERNLIEDNLYKFLWVEDFPLFEFDEEENRLKSMHHPFTSPSMKDLDILEKEPLKVRADAYDLVLNGYEIAGGSQRIYDSGLQAKIFKLLNLTDTQVKQKFGFFMEALQYGTPPHGGIAYGLDRLMMILTNTDNMREVIAFPKTLKSSDLMSQSPCPVDEVQLKELSIKTTEIDDIVW